MLLNVNTPFPSIYTGDTHTNLTPLVTQTHVSRHVWTSGFRHTHAHSNDVMVVIVFPRYALGTIVPMHQAAVRNLPASSESLNNRQAHSMSNTHMHLAQNFIVFFQTKEGDRRR